MYTSPLTVVNPSATISSADLLLSYGSSALSPFSIDMSKTLFLCRNLEILLDEETDLKIIITEEREEIRNSRKPPKIKSMKNTLLQK